jgi:hypothetical protein
VRLLTPGYSLLPRVISHYVVGFVCQWRINMIHWGCRLESVPCGFLGGWRCSLAFEEAIKPTTIFYLGNDQYCVGLGGRTSGFLFV